MYVSFDSGIRRRKHVASQLDVADNRQSLVRTLRVDANVTLSADIIGTIITTTIIIVIMV